MQRVVVVHEKNASGCAYWRSWSKTTSRCSTVKSARAIVLIAMPPFVDLLEDHQIASECVRCSQALESSSRKPTSAAHL